MVEGTNDVAPGEIRRGWAPAHSWRWFLLRSAKHIPKAARNQSEWKSLGASFFAILQAMGQAANEDGTNAFLGTDTLMAVGRCSKETVQKVLVAAEAVCLIKKTANARGGRHPKPATYACTLPLGADTDTGLGVLWERALAVLSSSEHDRRLRHKRASGTERHVTPHEQQLTSVQEPSRDAVSDGPNAMQKASRDASTERHVTDPKASYDAPTRSHQDPHHEMADAVRQPQLDRPSPPGGEHQDLREAGAEPSEGRADENGSAVAAANYARHAADCDRCPREMWCPQGARLRRYLTAHQNRQRMKYLGGSFQ
ncbi:hypothetical protein [Streptomyces racemochromogenes]|uniref:hypothetical protein n=1 Tax=Streptomyces racemochromogenes TaxID=67353 RepID=UPI0031EA7FD3